MRALFHPASLSDAFLPALEYSHAAPWHSRFSGEKPHATRPIGRACPRCAAENSAAASNAKSVFRLQHRGPPRAAIRASASAVAVLHSRHSSLDVGVASVTRLTKIPTAMAAPQAPWKPHEPPTML